MLQVTSDGRGVVTCLELADVQDKPALFSTFMMWLLAELYHNLPEAGDLPKPKLVFFFDEAHLLFDDASKAFLDQIQQVVRLIRSKGVGVYFVTQTPKDVPAKCWPSSATESSTPPRPHPERRRRRSGRPSRTFPKTEFYDLEETLTSLGIGEAVVTVLDPRGSPTPVVATRLIPPSLADGAAHSRGAAGRHPPVATARGVRPGGGSGERARRCWRRGWRGREAPPADGGAGSRDRSRAGVLAEERGGRRGAAVVGALSTSIGSDRRARRWCADCSGCWAEAAADEAEHAEPMVSVRSTVDSTSRT